MASPLIVKERLAQFHQALRQYEDSFEAKQNEDIKAEVKHRIDAWDEFMKKGVEYEKEVKTFVTKMNIKKWFGSYMIERALEWQADDPSTCKMQRLIDYPMRFVPVTENGKLRRVVDQQALTEQIARLFIKEQVSRSHSMIR